MKIISVVRQVLVGISVFLMIACSSVNVHPENSVHMPDGSVINLPQPRDLGQSFSVSQLITVTWNGETRQLPVQLNVDSDELVLAGFSAWGTRILSLKYAGGSIETSVLSGLEEQLPDPKDVLFYIMISLWPEDVWSDKLSASGWSLIDTSETRTLIDASGKSVVVIHYSDIADKLAGDIRLDSPDIGYSIVISTLKE